MIRNNHDIPVLLLIEDTENTQPFKLDKYSYLDYLEYVNVGYVLLSNDHTVLSHNKVIQNHLQNDRLMKNSVNSLDYSRLSNALKECKTISVDEGNDSFHNSSLLPCDSIEKKIDYFFERLFYHFIEIDELFVQEIKFFKEISNFIIPKDLNIDSTNRENTNKLKFRLPDFVKSVKHKLTNENFHRLGISKIPFRNKYMFLEMKIRNVKVDKKDNYYEILTMDVTEVYEAQITKNQMTYKSLGLAKVAHDFKNPILSLISLLPSESGNNINSYISSSDEESGHEQIPNARLKRSTRITSSILDLNLFDKNSLIKNLSNYMLTLIEDFNVYAKMDLDKVTENHSTIIDNPINEEIDIRPILEFSVNIFKIRQLNEKDKQKINICLVIDDNVPEKIRVNEIKLKQVMVNLLSNSYKFTLSGDILVRAKVFYDDEHKKFLRFTIQDTGVGIRKEDQPGLFAPFKMIENAKKLNNHGSGLGLLIIKEILHKMNSDIKFVSELGVGTTFWFDLEINSTITLLCQKSTLNVTESLSFIDQNMIITDSLANVFRRLNESMNSNEINSGNSKSKIEVSGYRNTHLSGSSSISSERKHKSSNDKMIIKSVRSLPKKNMSNGKSELKKIEELLCSKRDFLSEFNKAESLIRFLLCDDEEISLTALQNSIVSVCKAKMLNYEISLAKNGIECLYIMNLKIFQNEPIDILLIDDQMSIMNGGMTVKIIKDLINEMKIPSLLKYIVTSNSDSKKRKEFLENGCDDVVFKPISKTKIISIINDLLKR